MMYSVFDVMQCQQHGIGTGNTARGASGGVILEMGFSSLLKDAGTWPGSGELDATGRPLVRPDKAYEPRQRAPRIHSATHLPACPKCRLVLPSAHVLGFRLSAALSNGPCLLV
jgi:hypothetical protein